MSVSEFSGKEQASQGFLISVLGDRGWGLFDSCLSPLETAPRVLTVCEHLCSRGAGEGGCTDASLILLPQARSTAAASPSLPSLCLLVDGKRWPVCSTFVVTSWLGSEASGCQDLVTAGVLRAKPLSSLTAIPRRAIDNQGCLIQ